MTPLPFIDEHGVDLEAPAERTWAALVETLRAEFGEAAWVARVLGCDPARGTAGFEGRVGEALPGFRVAGSEPGRCLALRGRHRFSRYELTFFIDEGRLRARTAAGFPGALGRLYRAAVIGTGGHRLVTRRLLRQIARRTRSDRPEPGGFRPARSGLRVWRPSSGRRRVDEVR